MLKHYNSIADLRQDYLNLSKGSRGYDLEDAKWYGGETERATLIYTAAGDTALVPAAERLITDLEMSVETPRRTWERAPAGAWCSVPDVLAGLPTPMRRQVITNDDRAPVTILVCTTSSAAISAKTLQKRGTVILALAMAMARIRPISLRVMAILDGSKDGTGETVITAEVNTTPLDLATACYVLTSAGFARRLTYGLIEKLNNTSGSWPRGYKFGSPAKYFNDLVPRLGLNPKDTLVIGSAELGDQLLTEPVEWINAQINRFTVNQEENVI